MFLDVFFEKAAEQHADAIAIEQGETLFTSTGKQTLPQTSWLTCSEQNIFHGKTKW